MVFQKKLKHPVSLSPEERCKICASMSKHDSNAYLFFIIILCFQEFSRFHKEIQPMFDGLNNNRAHWNELAEVYNAKMKAIEDEKKKLEEEEARKGKRSILRLDHTL